MFYEKKIMVFLDDFNLINVESEIEIFSIKIEKKDFLVEIYKGNEKKKKMTLETKEKFILNQEYVIHVNNNIIVPLIKRGIVQTKKFDDKYYYPGKLGHVYNSSKTSFKLWAPIASEVVLKIGNKKIFSYHVMNHNNGIYSIDVKGDLKLCEYNFIVRVNGELKEVVDPYAYSSSVNSKSSIVVDINNLKSDAKFKKKPKYDPVVCEVSIRDFTSNEKFNFKNKGKFLGFVESGIKNSMGQAIGIDYLVDMKYDYIQLMPMYDFGSVDESIVSDENYNWGYDPVQYNTCEGSYLVKTDGNSRIKEPIKMINKIKSKNMGVIMDVVYNHVYDQKTFSFNQVTPFYFNRYDENFDLLDGSFCGNEVASERKMVRKFIIDSLELFVDVYKVDGFRIDLMGLMDVDTINLAYKKLSKINPNILIYGEGWNMNCGLKSGDRATQINANKLRKIAFFDDDFRDLVKGSYSDTIKLGLINETNKDTNIKKLDKGIKINSHKKYVSTKQMVRYVSCHDDHTLYDYISMFTNDENMKKKQVMECYDYIFKYEGIKFVHLGCEFLRSKNGIKNTYNSCASINNIQWDLISENSNIVNHLKELIKINRNKS